MTDAHEQLKERITSRLQSRTTRQLEAIFTLVEGLQYSADAERFICGLARSVRECFEATDPYYGVPVHHAEAYRGRTEVVWFDADLHKPSVGQFVLFGRARPNRVVVGYWTGAIWLNSIDLMVLNVDRWAEYPTYPEELADDYENPNRF